MMTFGKRHDEYEGLILPYLYNEEEFISMDRVIGPLYSFAWLLSGMEICRKDSI